MLFRSQREELQRLSKKAYNVLRSLKINLKDLQDKMHNILSNSLSEFSKTEDIDIKKIEELFNKTIKESIDALSETLEKSYQDQLKQTDIFLYDGVVAEKVLNVLAMVLEFQKQLDKVYPGASEKIIKSLETILVGVIATQFPMVGMAIKASGFLDKLNKFISHENLLPKVKKWQADIARVREEIKASDKLRNIEQQAEKVAEISEIIDAKPLEIIEVAKSPDNKEALSHIAEAAALFPANKKAVEDKISKIKNDIEKVVLKDISPEKLTSINKIVFDRLDEAKKELLNVINPNTSFIEKLSSLCKAAEKTSNIVNEVKKVVGSKEMKNTLEPVITASVKLLVPPQIMALSKITPKIAKLAKIGEVVKMLLNKTNILGQAAARSKG